MIAKNNTITPVTIQLIFPPAIWIPMLITPLHRSLPPQLHSAHPASALINHWSKALHQHPPRRGIATHTKTSA